MTIREFYTRFNVPPDVQAHMLAVGALVSEMRKYWVGPTLDWMVVTKAALLHNMGGIVELDLDDARAEISHDERHDSAYWKEEQKKVMEEYGDSVKTVTTKMNKKIGLDKFLSGIIAHGVVQNVDAVANAFDLHTKVFLYCDARILLRDSASHAHETQETCLRAREILESQLSSYVYIPIQDITADPSASCRYDLENIDVRHYKNPSL